MKKLIIINLLVLFMIKLSFAQEGDKNRFISLEIDPAPFILNGYSFSLKYNPKFLNNTTIMGSIYSSDLPDALINKTNKDNGWAELELKTSYAIFVDYHFSDNFRGFHIGPSLFYYNKSVKLTDINEIIKFSTIYPNVRFGYTWFPFENINFYLNPWVNIGSEINIDSKNQFNGIEYNADSFSYILALHLGYRFEFN